MQRVDMKYRSPSAEKAVWVLGVVCSAIAGRSFVVVADVDVHGGAVEPTSRQSSHVFVPRFR